MKKYTIVLKHPTLPNWNGVIECKNDTQMYSKLKCMPDVIPVHVKQLLWVSFFDFDKREYFWKVD